MRYSAGLRTEPNGADFRFDYVTARGGFEAADYLDGMRRPTSFYSPRTEIYTLERIEVLRGPSSVLYGQGAAGGIVNSMSKRPQYERAGEIGLEYGSFDRRQLQFDLTGPLDDDGRFAGRVVAVARRAQTQVDYGRDDRLLIAPSLRWQPGEDTDIVLQALWQQDRAASIASWLPVSASLQAPPGREIPWGRYLGEPGLNHYDGDQTSASLVATHDFSERVRLQSALRYNRSKSNNAAVEVAVWNGLENPFLDADRRLLPRDRYDSKSRLGILTTDHHLNVDFGSGRWQHRALVGVDYSRVKLHTWSAWAEAGPIDIYAPVYGNVPEAALEALPTAVETQLGFYLQDQIRYDDWLTLVVGGRRDRAGTEVDGTAGQIDTATTWRVGLIADVRPSLSPYLSYSESFQPTVGLDFYGNPFVPQRGRQLEAGLKWEPASRTLVTAAVFDITGTNRPTNDPSNGENIIQQGEVKSKGFELEAGHELRGGFAVLGSYSYVDAQTRRSGEPLEIGLPISAVPRHQASLWGRQSWALAGGATLRLGAGLRHVGASEEAVVLDGAVARLRTPGFTLVDALVALERGPWSFALNATNLFDREYYASCSVRTACGPGYRRNVVGTASLKF